MQAPLNDLYATSVDVMKRLAEGNWHAWDRFTEQQNKLLGVCAELFDGFRFDESRLLRCKNTLFAECHYAL